MQGEKNAQPWRSKGVLRQPQSMSILRIDKWRTDLHEDTQVCIHTPHQGLLCLPTTGYSTRSQSYIGRHDNVLFFLAKATTNVALLHTKAVALSPCSHWCLFDTQKGQKDGKHQSSVQLAGPGKRSKPRGCVHVHVFTESLSNRHPLGEKVSLREHGGSFLDGLCHSFMQGRGQLGTISSQMTRYDQGGGSKPGTGQGPPVSRALLRMGAGRTMVVGPWWWHQGPPVDIGIQE